MIVSRNLRFKREEIQEEKGNHEEGKENPSCPPKKQEFIKSGKKNRDLEGITVDFGPENGTHRV